MSRSPLLAAIIDEVDQAIARLQTARRFLGELQRDMPRVPVVAPPGVEESVAPTSLRHGGLSVPEAAELLGMSEEHVRRLLRSGDLQGIAYSGRVGWRLSRTYVEAVAEARRQSRENQAAAREMLRNKPVRNAASPRPRTRKPSPRNQGR